MHSAHFDIRLPVLTTLGVRDGALAPMRGYLDLLWAANDELNLISRKMTPEELIDNHVIDCLLPLRSFPRGVRVAADFGSGGGLPGVLYALQFPETRYLLFEKSPKKREFLEQCRKLAPNLEIHAEIPPDPKDVEIVNARAFKPLDVILDVSRGYYKRGGKYFLLKGRREKIDEEAALARKKFKDLHLEIQPLASPVLDVERHLVLMSSAAARA